MKTYQRSAVERWRRAWWRYHGERPLVTTFWPQDYPIGSLYQQEGYSCSVTHRTHATDGQFYEIWGKPKPEGVALGLIDPAYIERQPDLMPRVRQRSIHS